PERIERLVAIEALGALAEDIDRSALRLHRAFSEPRATRRSLRVFPDIATAVETRVASGGIEVAAARLLVERGVAPARFDESQGGYTWCSDPRLTRPTAIRMSEDQVRDLLTAIECPTRVVYANPAQPYFPEALRRARFACLRHGQLVVLDGGHHLHMEQPEAVAAAIGGHFAGRRHRACAVPLGSFAQLPAGHRGVALPPERQRRVAFVLFPGQHRAVLVLHRHDLLPALRGHPLTGISAERVDRGVAAHADHPHAVCVDHAAHPVVRGAPYVVG